MAFVKSNLGKVGGGQGGTPALWTYVDGTDDTDDFDTSGYFNEAADLLKVGDFILAKGAASAGILVVVSNSGGVVDCANATEVSVADSD